MDFLAAHQSHLPLENIRNVLIRLEDTIIFALIERAQFKLNPCIYQPRHFEFLDGSQHSFLYYFLHQVEKVHGTFSANGKAR
jgi:chorismate mutase